MVGSDQSGRCNLGSGLGACPTFGRHVDPWRSRSRLDWAMDSELLRIGGGHEVGLFLPSMRFFSKPRGVMRLFRAGRLGVFAGREARRLLPNARDGGAGSPAYARRRRWLSS
jgi:hypothetical protein